MELYNIRNQNKQLIQIFILKKKGTTTIKHDIQLISNPFNRIIQMNLSKCLSRIDLPNIRSLYLDCNDLCNIRDLRKHNWQNLTSILLGGNKIYNDQSFFQHPNVYQTVSLVVTQQYYGKQKPFFYRQFAKICHRELKYIGAGIRGSSPYENTLERKIYNDLKRNILW